MAVRSVPLAWKNLAHKPGRFALFASGVGFAVVLMGVQLGIMFAMLDGYTLLVTKISGDLVLVNPARSSLIFREAVSRRRLDKALTVPGVRAVAPLYLDTMVGVLRNPAGGTTSRPGAESGLGAANGPPPAATQNRFVRVIGVDPDAGILNVPRAELDKLRVPGTALIDARSRANPDRPGETVFGVPAENPPLPLATELSGRNITLVGTFEMGFDFSTDGTVVVSDRTFSRWIREPYTAPLADPMADADLGVVRLEPGADPAAVKADLAEAFAPLGDVEVMTVRELGNREMWFWLSNTPIGFAFGAGVVLGFFVGMVICYQILAGDIADHLPEYATLKAVGYTNRYLNAVVLQEALILAAAGYAIGIVVTWAAYLFLTDLTGLKMSMTAAKFFGILALTVAMCVGSGMLAVGKVKKVDPADVF
jgi:putative ABC transport system permease protein